MRLITTPEDDPDFVRVVTAILDSVVGQCTPRIVTAIQIDNWFDHKWLEFSGKVHGALGIWKRELTIPPFNPNRVKNQTVYRLGENAEYEEIEAPLLHMKQPSSENMKRKLKACTDSGVFAWWTSNTVANGKGSVMVYSQIGDESSSWMASFLRAPEWRVNKTNDISVEAINQLMGRVEQGALAGSDKRLR